MTRITLHLALIYFFCTFQQSTSLISLGHRFSPLQRLGHVTLSARRQREVNSKVSDNQGQRRKKKNKYAKFSKTDNLAKDPMDALIAESENKLQEMELEKAKRRNTAIPLSEREMSEKRERNKFVFPDAKSIDPNDPSTFGYTELGTIIGAHGVKGLVKVASVTDFAERLCQPGPRHLKPHNRRSPRAVELLSGRHRMDDEYLVKLSGIGDRDAANKLRGSVLYARQEERPKAVASDEYLVTDLVDLEVFIEEGYIEDEDDPNSASLGGSFVGSVFGVVLGSEMCPIPGLGQDMLEIVLPRGLGGTASWKDEMVLIPLVPQIVPRIDLKEKKIFITPPSGLLDLTYVHEEKVRIKGFLPPAKE
mmetsp:Transcript_31199/g.47784  ORF Transcript_31199/g.47784 Transcript_31199/m.47784 type:complete len:363 (+) Transcript_31199:105-1193(+)